MRVLMTTDTVGGVWTFTRELTEGLLTEGCFVMLVSLGREASADQSAWASDIAKRWPHDFRFLPTTFALEWMQDNANFYAESAALLEHSAIDFRADLIHTNQLCYGTLASHRPTLVTAHSDVHSWFAACRGYQPPASPWIERYDHLVRRGLQSADTVTAPTAWMVKQAEQHFGPFRNSTVVPNGRELPPPFATPARKKQAVTAGRLWDEAKDVALLEEVTSPIPLFVAGERSGPDATTHHLTSHVQWVGHLTEPDLLHLFRSSLVYLATSRYEPFGLAPLEAALCGCALVMRDLPSFREVWCDAALYFRDAAELSNILQTLDRDEALVRTMAKRATDRAQQNFTRQQMTHRYLHLYRATLDARTDVPNTERYVA